MSETTDKPKLGARAPLGLKRTVETGKVKQSFSHGRSNTVVVEVKKRRILRRPGEAEAPKVEAAPAPVAPPPAPKPAAPKPAAPAGRRRRARARNCRRSCCARPRKRACTALEEARRREDKQAKAQTEDEKRRAEENRKAEEAAAEAARARRRGGSRAAPPSRPAEAPAAPQPAAAPRRTSVPAPATARAMRPPSGPSPPGPAAAATSIAASAASSPSAARSARTATPAPAASPRSSARARRKSAPIMQAGPSAKQVRDVVVPEAITVAELANRMAERAADLVKSLFKMGMPVTVNETIDQDTAELLVTEFGHNIKRVSEADVDIQSEEDVDAAETLQPRPPVVTIMGHVDHGKTSLLDAIRGANVVSGEAGGITQHIGAYQVSLPDKSKVTFLDTPGHEAFTEMRARGANVTDIVILVVAADDGLKPQTIEAINHTKAAGVPMIVAINKIDKPGANPQKVREELLQHEIIVEEMGGEVQDVEVSALKKTNLDKLLEAIALQAELLELKANPDRAAEGAVVEAKLDKGRGPLATVLVQRGTLRVGDIFVAGPISGKVRAMIDDKGRQVKEAGPEPAGRGARPLAACRRPATCSAWSRTRRAPARSPPIARA